jgi:hypothetical protein
MKLEVIMPGTTRRLFTDEYKPEAVRLTRNGPAVDPGGSEPRDIGQCAIPLEEHSHLSTRPLRRRSHPSYNTPPCEAPMPFTIRPCRRSSVPCSATYHAGSFHSEGTAWNLADRHVAE